MWSTVASKRRTVSRMTVATATRNAPTSSQVRSAPAHAGFGSLDSDGRRIGVTAVTRARPAFYFTYSGPSGDHSRISSVRIFNIVIRPLGSSCHVANSTPGSLQPKSACALLLSGWATMNKRTRPLLLTQNSMPPGLFIEGSIDDCSIRSIARFVRADRPDLRGGAVGGSVGLKLVHRELSVARGGRRGDRAGRGYRAPGIHASPRAAAG